MSQPSASLAPSPSVKTQPSETAMATAMMRALAAHDERAELRGPDTMAELFLSEDRLAPLKDSGVRAWVMKNKIAPGAYEFMIARTRFFDELVKRALAEGLPQLVLLGAGYDTRAYRFRDMAGSTHIFELDALPTQQRKREVLQRAGVPFPPHLQFVRIDFDADDLEPALMGAGFAKNARALFLWEGVSYYVSLEAVNRTVAAVRSAAAPGSSIAFDYASLSAEALSEEGIQKLRDHEVGPFRRADQVWNPGREARAVPSRARVRSGREAWPNRDGSALPRTFEWHSRRKGADVVLARACEDDGVVGDVELWNNLIGTPWAHIGIDNCTGCGLRARLDEILAFRAKSSYCPQGTLEMRREGNPVAVHAV